MTIGTALEPPLRAELMDAHDLSFEDTARALADLDRVNRWLLGYGASCRTLLGRIAAGPRCQTLIDLGTGSGRVSTKLRQLALRRGVSLRVIEVDRKLGHLLFGRKPGEIQLRVVADVEALPFHSGATDWSFSNLLFHHFGTGKNEEILAEMRRVARRAAVVVDLRRSLCARLLIRVLLPLLRIGPVATYDGKLSTDQSWSLVAVRRLTADQPVLELRRRFPFRFSLVLPGAEAIPAGHAITQ